MPSATKREGTAGDNRQRIGNELQPPTLGVSCRIIHIARWNIFAVDKQLWIRRRCSRKWHASTSKSPTTKTVSNPRTRMARRLIRFIPDSISSVPRWFALAPIMRLARRIERALNVSVQHAQDADACDHGWPTAFSYEDQRFHGGLPFRRVVLGF